MYLHGDKLTEYHENGYGTDPNREITIDDAGRATTTPLSIRGSCCMEVLTFGTLRETNLGNHQLLARVTQCVGDLHKRTLPRDQDRTAEAQDGQETETTLWNFNVVMFVQSGLDLRYTPSTQPSSPTLPTPDHLVCR